MRNLKHPIDRQQLGKISHSVRVAQAIMQYGVGAMVDFPDQTLIAAAPEYWKNNIINIHDTRLEQVLGVKRFGLPKGRDECKEGISYARFPQWYFCPKCRTFQLLEKWVHEYREKVGSRRPADKYMKRPVCTRCNFIELVPTRIVVACRAGHLDDFPWIEWVHERNVSGRKEICNNPELKFKTGANSSAGLEGLTVECTNCTAKATLEKSFNKDALKELLSSYVCRGFMPWKNTHEPCNEIPQAKQRGASSVYYPKVDSSLVIPPYSNLIISKIQSSQEYALCLLLISDFDEDERIERIQSRLQKWSENIALEINRDAKSVLPFLEMLLLKTSEQQPDESLQTAQETYRHAEYEALTGKATGGDDDGDFIREEIKPDEYGIPGLQQVVLLHKIREIRALIGFTRLDPPSNGQLGIPNNDIGRFQCVKESEADWFPGYEVRGEGIFLVLNNEELELWLCKNKNAKDRIKKLNNNLKRNLISEARTITLKFVFLHTLAHLLIRQLSFECGYNTASLRERIYCDVLDPSFPMCGLFIYTASGDSEGTLGGLVRQGRQNYFPQIFKRAIENALWCSNDPVCIDSSGQGRDGLNMSACHSCALLPETSCEEFNVFLDRSLLIGTINNRNYGYYSNWIMKNTPE